MSLLLLPSAIRMRRANFKILNYIRSHIEEFFKKTDPLSENVQASGTRATSKAPFLRFRDAPNPPLIMHQEAFSGARAASWLSSENRGSGVLINRTKLGRTYRNVMQRRNSTWCYTSVTSDVLNAATSKDEHWCNCELWVNLWNYNYENFYTIVQRVHLCNV